ncbi:unnamed protein product [Ceutorhynchus assimilis]|uniref:CCDC66 domain-containing protein n=1 Tax=Ceutorhynchus assimilis TaxID=467358 RepID=A0A9N9MV52_9CUCU|nr:unnamed protein product [Ceutorhynchus assimilis]
MTTQSYHSMSLVERKKQQWAREREELANLGVPFRQYSQSSGNSDRSHYGSKPSLTQKEPPPSETYQRTSTERRSSLPPLYQNQYNSNYDFKHDKTDRGGETSGYGSDSYPTPEYKKQNLPPAGNNSQWPGGNYQSGYESSSSCRDDRPRWGDKGVGVGKFWQPKEEPYDQSTNDPPNWVKRGLEADGAIVVANSSPSVSPEQRYEENDRPCTGSSFSHQHKTYIRGQNIPIDSVELAQRERRRQLALAHQEAIRQQLEEREKKRQEERARRIREEREEELRIEREQEFERRRKLEEERAIQEKLERERKRKEAIKQALEIAEKEAKLEKIKLRMMKQSNGSNSELNNITENIVEKPKLPASEVNENVEEKLNNTKDISLTPKKDNITKEINNNLSEPPEIMPNPSVSPSKSTTSLHSSVINNNQERSLTPIMQSPRNNQFTYFFQPTLDTLQNIQYAVLIPSAQYPVALPVSEINSVLNSARTENRILTPTRYRNNVSKCDSSTQTDSLNSARSSSETGEKYLRDKMSNMDLSYENKRRDRRSRSESMDERPKWGVNRPPTRYMKQSEKDPLYQRRKLRQKRDNANKSYDEKNSSDDSHIGTPVRYRKKDVVDKRHSRARWRTEERMFNGNLKMYQREIAPLESDRDHLYVKCCCNCRRHKVDILKIEENSPRDSLERKNSLPEFDTTNDHRVDLLSKLSTLHNGLLLEQEKWENSPQTPTLLSPRHRT